MKIYTKVGDAGQTSFFTGKKVWKDDPILMAYGTIDEAAAHLALVAEDPAGHPFGIRLTWLQHQFFALGSDLATPWPDGEKPRIRRFGAADVAHLETWIDSLTEQ